MSVVDLARVPEWYHKYISQIKENQLSKAFEEQSGPFARFLQDLHEEKRDYRYAEGKWSIKELLQHLIDAERIFCYRALRFARKDQTPLAGFDENEYAANAKTENRKWDDLVNEFNLVRKSTEIFFNSLDEEQLETDGVSSGNTIYVKALGFIIVGHLSHHLQVIRERYL